jgi:hypothetical protein
VLYQLSYCGEPESAAGQDRNEPETRPKTPAPDIGRGAILQEKRMLRRGVFRPAYAKENGSEQET